MIVQCYEESWLLNGQIIQAETFQRFVTPFEHLFFKTKCDFLSGKEMRESESPDAQFKDLFESADSINIFTDGSKLLDTAGRSRVGFGIWCEERFFEMSKRIPDGASIYTAESFAIISALNMIENWCNKLTNTNTTFNIFSDSESALKALESISGLNKESPIIAKIKGKLHELLCGGVKVKLCWVPAHVGIQGNEYADKLAKGGAGWPYLSNVDIPSSDLVSLFKSKCNEKNIEKLKEISLVKGTFYFKNFFSTSKRPWFCSFKVHRKVVSVINRIRSGHTRVKTDLYKYKIVNSSLCDCGEFDETVEHIFWQCNRHEIIRGKMVRRLRRLKIYGPYSIINILSEINDKTLAVISDFIIEGNIMI